MSKLRDGVYSSGEKDTGEDSSWAGCAILGLGDRRRCCCSRNWVHLNLVSLGSSYSFTFGRDFRAAWSAFRPQIADEFVKDNETI